MTNYIVSRALNFLDLPHIQSGLTTDEEEFNVLPGYSTDRSTQRAMDWLWPRNSWLMSRHGITGFLKGLNAVSLEYMEANCRLLSQKQAAEPIFSEEAPLPSYILYDPSGPKITDACDLISDGIINKGGDFWRSDYTTRNLRHLVCMDFLEF